MQQTILQVPTTKNLYGTINYENKTIIKYRRV
jgi:hypothetical protein